MTYPLVPRQQGVDWPRRISDGVNTSLKKLQALSDPAEDADSYASGLKVGSNLFNYNLGAIVRVNRALGTVSGAMHNMEVVTSGKGDNTNYRPIYNAWFEFRDPDDVTSGTKNAGYALSLSVAIRQARNNVPVDDVACLTMGMTGGIATAKGTDCMYISENPIYTAAGNSEWYSLFTADAKADVGYQVKYRPSTGHLANWPNDSYLYWRNAADSAYGKVLGIASDNSIAFGDSSQHSRIDIPVPINLISSLKLNGATPTVSSGYLGIGATTATSATAGANGATPAQVAGYLVLNLGGTSIKVPYYAA